MSCCTSILDLGCFYSCDNISTGITASATGTYILVLMPDSIQLISQTMTSGTEIIFSSGYLNEDKTAVFKIKKPNGDYLTSGSYDCFQVDIKPSVNPALADPCESGGSATCTYDVYINSVFSQQVTLVNCADLTINII